MPPSLYANLLDPAAASSSSSSTSSSSPATISGAPVKYSFKKDEQPPPAQDKKAPDVASLRFQPSIKRPQPQQKQKQRSIPTPPTKVQPALAPTPPQSAPAPVIQKWQDSHQQDFDVVNEYHKFQEEQKARVKEERKARKKKNPSLLDRDIDWSAPYNVQDAFTKTRTKLRLDAWRNSESKFNARIQWKEKLHEFRRPDVRPVRDAPKPALDISYKNMPPPQEFSALPTTTAQDASSPPPPVLPPSHQQSAVPPPPPPPSQVTAFPPPPHHIAAFPPPPPPPPQVFGFPPPPPQPIAGFHPPPPPVAGFQLPPPPPINANLPAPPPPQTTSEPEGIISRAPVRYERPEPVPEDQDTTAPTPEVTEDQEPEPRSNLPGQKGFAQRYMEKHGWKKGEGLGRDASGITTILRHEPAKRKRKPDAEGGGWAQPAAMGRIVGGKRVKASEPIDESKAFSLVAKFDGMLKDVDIDRAIEEDNLMQNIGERMNDYGRSERVYVDRSTGRVFVKFTSALSTFNAIKASDGVDFLANGRIVQASFYNAEKFEEGIYD